MKRNRVRLYLLGLLTGGLLVGCTTGAVEEIVPEESRPITLSFGKPDLGVPEVVTRADTPAPTPLPVGATVRICAYFIGQLSDASTTPAVFAASDPSFEATYVVGADGALSPCLVDDSGTLIAGKAEGLTVRGGIYDFYAVSPARKLAKDTDNNYKITDIQHKEDVMTSTTRKVKVSKDFPQITLGTFQRKCALVVFNVAPSKDNEFPFTSLYGTGLVIKKISSSGVGLIAGDGTGIPPTGGATGAEAVVTFAANEFEPVESGADPDNCGLNKTKGIVLPKTNAPFEVEISVVREGKTATLKATIDKSITFAEGKRYIFTLEVKETESSLLMKVLGWNTVAFTDANVGGPDSPYPDPDINEGIGTTITVATWKVINWSGNGDIGGNPPGVPPVTIDQALATAYNATGINLTEYPPFNYDNGNVTGGGSDDKGISSSCTITTPYTIEVESTQSASKYLYNNSAAKNYCTSKGAGWRLPTQIELFAMWTKCKGTNNNATDSEAASTALGAKFAINSCWYWSSSVSSGNSNYRSVLDFSSGTVFLQVTYNQNYVRCVRDKN